MQAQRLLFDGHFREFNILESLVFHELDASCPYLTALIRSTLGAQCFYRCCLAMAWT